MHTVGCMEVNISYAAMILTECAQNKYLVYLSFRFPLSEVFPSNCAIGGEKYVNPNHTAVNSGLHSIIIGHIIAGLVLILAISSAVDCLIMWLLYCMRRVLFF